MDLFKTAQRIPPSRIPIVRTLDRLPDRDLVLPSMRAPSRRGLAILGAGLGLVGLVAVFTFQPDQATAPGPRQSQQPGASGWAGGAGPVKGARDAPRPGGGGGGGGGGAEVVVRNVVVLTASESLVAQMKRMVFTLKKNPSTLQNLSDRLGLFEKYFNSLNADDRRALFGCTDFQQMQKAILAQRDNSPGALDRCLAQLQLVLF